MSAAVTLERGVLRGVPVVSARGDIDFSNAADVRRFVEAAVTPSDPGLVLDLRALSYLDSGGIHLLGRLHLALLAHRQELRVVLPEPSPIRTILQLSGLDGQLLLDTSLDEAVEALNSRS